MLVEEVKSVEIDHPACAFPDLAEGVLAQGTDLAEDARDGGPLGAEDREPILREQACGGREKREVAPELGSGSAAASMSSYITRASGSGVVPGRTTERRIGFFNALFPLQASLLPGVYTATHTYGRRA